MNNRIYIFKDHRGWHAKYSGDHAAEIQKLFETAILPLPYTAFANSEKVLREMQERYPDVIVEISEKQQKDDMAEFLKALKQLG